MMFIDSVDLFEQVMTSQQDYKLLHEYFREGDMMERFRNLIAETAHELDRIGLVVQSGFPSKDKGRLDQLIRETEEAFVAYRNTHLTSTNIEGFISLRHVLNSVKDIAERIKRLHRYSTYSSEVSKEVKPDTVDAEKFVSSQEMDLKLFAGNLSWRSNIFRHSLRVSICILTGYIIAQFFPFGHSYWILLTIVTILKPAYGLTKKRNIERLMGTLAGAGSGFLLLSLVHNNTALFVCLILSMIIGYSFLQIRYVVSVVGITLYVLLSFHFLHPVDFRMISTDRVIDTMIGSAISFLGALFIFPKWEQEQVPEYLEKLMEANLRYFAAVSQAFYQQPEAVNTYKITRKEAYVALANLSDAFQRLLSEPKKNVRNTELLHQLVVSNHMLTSHIASLATYAVSLAPRYKSDAFKPVAESIQQQMKNAMELLQHKTPAALKDAGENSFSRVRDMVQGLLHKRLEEIKEGTEFSNVRKELSGYKTIADQFELIQTIITDINNILRKQQV